MGPSCLKRMFICIRDDASMGRILLQKNRVAGCGKIVRALLFVFSMGEYLTVVAESSYTKGVLTYGFHRVCNYA